MAKQIHVDDVLSTHFDRKQPIDNRGKLSVHEAAGDHTQQAYTPCDKEHVRVRGGGDGSGRHLDMYTPRRRRRRRHGRSRQ